MKRLLALVLAIAMVLGVALLAGCDDTPAEKTTDSSSKSETSSTKASDTSSTTGGNDGTTASTPSGSEDGTTASTPSGGEDSTTASSDTEPVGGDPMAGWDPYTKLPGYEDLSFGGATFTIAGYKDAEDGYDTEREVYSEDTDTIADGANTRTATVEKFYNCDITFVGAESPNTYLDAASAGGAPVHLACIKYSHLNVATNGKYYNLYNYDIDLTQPYWDQKYVNNFTLQSATGNKLYGVIGDFALQSYASITALLFNTDLYDTTIKQTLGYDIYQLVRDGKWTMDVWMEMINKAAYDANGNSEINPADGDTVGWLYATSVGFYNLHKASGLKMADKVDGQWKFVMSENAAQWANVISKAIEVKNAKGAYGQGYTQAVTDVASGKCLFYTEIISKLEDETLTGSDVKLSIVPYPKYSEAQAEYSSFVENHVMTYSIPVSVANPDEVADFFTVYAAHSTGIVRPAWINAYAYEYLSGTQSAEMLEYVLDSRDYDLGYHMFSWQGEIHDQISNDSANITRMIERRASTWTNDLNTAITNITNNAN